jgi:DNA primase
MAMGFRNVVASLSVNGLKDDIFEKIINSNVKKVFIAFDNDNPGNTAALSLAEKLIDHKIESYRIVFDDNSDANDLLRKSESTERAKERFKELLENAPALKQVIDTVQSNGYHADSLTKKGKEYLYKIGQREYTIRGLDQNKSDSSLKIFLRLDYHSEQANLPSTRLSRKYGRDNFVLTGDWLPQNINEVIVKDSSIFN